jgi:hypothetical protein
MVSLRLPHYLCRMAIWISDPLVSMQADYRVSTLLFFRTFLSLGTWYHTCHSYNSRHFDSPESVCVKSLWLATPWSVDRLGGEYTPRL